MGLNISKGNMYSFVTHTWNAVKGQCYHDCSYCYMKRWGKLNPVRLDAKEFKTDLGSGNSIFVGSSCDMFASDIEPTWIRKVLEHCAKFDNDYLFQTKDPSAILNYTLPDNSVVCTTIETNRYYQPMMGLSPSPHKRAIAMTRIVLPKYVTIEPIVDFDVKELLEYVKMCNPIQVNIGADSGKNGLPEPSKEKVLELIEGLKEFTTIDKKKNLSRLLK